MGGACQGACFTRGHCAASARGERVCVATRACPRAPPPYGRCSISAVTVTPQGNYCRALGILFDLKEELAMQAVVA